MSSPYEIEATLDRWVGRRPMADRAPDAIVTSSPVGVTGSDGGLRP